MDTTLDHSAEQSVLRFPVDSEHSALRLSVILIFVVVWVAAFSALNLLIPNDGLNLIAGIGGLVVAGILTRGIESQLKLRWPSGRIVEVDAAGIRILLKDTAQHTVSAGEPMSILLWRFEIKRRNRVPKGWYVVACAVEQDDDYLPVYALVSPQQADALNTRFKFPLLVSEKEQPPAGLKQDSLRAAGEQRRLRQAESFRWNAGVEMSPEDFERYISHLNGHFSQWMPVNR